jgi:predicted Zn-dependent peptidase
MEGKVEIKQIDFKNRTKLCFHPMQQMESVSIGIWVKTGSRYETEENSGVSHFLEHLLFKGTKNRTSLQISQEIEGTGGVLNGFTSEEYTCFYVKVLKNHLRKAVDILFDMVLNPLLKTGDIEKEKGIIVEELNMYLDIPSHYVDDLLSETMWSGHPLGRRILGRPETIKSMNRKKILDYMRNNYCAPNIVVAVAGHASLGWIEALITPYVSKLDPGCENSFEDYANRQKKPGIRLEKKNIEQTQIAMGFKTYSRLDPRRYKAKLLSLILGGNMSSRLFQEVREKHSLAYAVHSQLNQYVDIGAFEIQTGVKNQSASRALDVIAREITKIKRQAVKKQELSMAKEYMIGQILLSIENTKNNMLQIGENMLTLGRVVSIKETLNEIRKVKIEDIIETARDVFMPENANIAVFGNCPEKRFVEDILTGL